MALKILGQLPKAQGGRKPTAADQTIVDAAIKLLTDSPYDAKGRPNLIGDSARTFDSEGKASADGRRHARPVAEALDKVVKVRVLETAENSGKFGWVLYLTMTQAADETDETPAAGEE
jgi:hypothetical protein